MRIYKTKVFRRFQRKEGIRDDALVEAISRAEAGLVDADLGRHLIKQRVARDGRGRRGGYRTIVAYRVGAIAFFLHGFAKRQQDNLSPDDEIDMAETGAQLLGLSAEKLRAAIQQQILWEVKNNDEKK